MLCRDWLTNLEVCFKQNFFHLKQTRITFFLPLGACAVTWPLLNNHIPVSLTAYSKKKSSRTFPLFFALFNRNLTRPFPNPSHTDSNTEHHPSGYCKA